MEPRSFVYRMSIFGKVGPMAKKTKNRGIIRRNGYITYDLESTDVKRICDHGILTRAQEIELATRIRKGDEEAVKTLVSHNLRLVVSCAKQFVTPRISLGDAINIGVVGLEKAARGYDPSRGTKFSTYAAWWIRSALRLEFWETRSAVIHVPHGNRGLSSRSYSGEELTPAEEKTLRLTKAAQNNTNDVYNLPMSLEPVSREEVDTDALEREEAVERLRRAFERLLPKDQYLLGMRFGMGKFDKPLSLRQIGEIEGITAEAVRQKEQRAKARLRAILEEGD